LNSSIFVKGALEGMHGDGDLYNQGISISIANLNAWYGNLQALKDVNLNIPRHHITAFIGPSGCGKTTLLGCLNRMNDLLSGFSRTGSIELDGEDIYAREYKVMNLRKKVGMVFQDPNPFPMSIYNNLKLPLDENNKIDRLTAEDIIIKKLKDAGLYDEVKQRLHKSALKLSGGQQQRLCIARALTIEPEVLLLDEPCSALDPISIAKIETLLTEIKRRYTIVIVTHNLQQAARIADYVVFFYQGEIVEQGLAKEIFVNPKEERTEDYLRGII
jgi:phosphate transport system ATP-binding protein